MAVAWRRNKNDNLQQEAKYKVQQQKKKKKL